MKQTDFVETVFTETSMEQVDAVLYQAMFDETVRLRRCTSKSERDSIRKFLTEAYQVFAERNHASANQGTFPESMPL